jgi:pyridoxal phosphate enzyme (YggS family)
MIKQEQYLQNLQILRQRINHACNLCGRDPEEVTLLPVTKNWPVDAVEYCRDAGICRVGENRVQEAIEKQNYIAGIDWELIGHLQSNKVNQVVGRFSRIQTLDSLKLIRKVQAASERIDCKTAVLLQVNAGNDPAKYGFSHAEAPAALDEVLACSHLLVDGLMTIAPYVPDDLSVASDCFQKLAELKNALEDSHAVKLRELSMGMSGDLNEAIACGSTMIRVGSALFGDR